MNILAPLNHIEFLDAFVEAGADEFFLGFYESKDQEKFGRYFELNRMSGFREDASGFSFEELKYVITLIKNKGKAVYITFNSAGYTTENLEYINKYIKGLVDVGVDGFIVSCPEAVQAVVQNKGVPVISGIGAVYNSYTADYYKKLGAKRIILPRDLSIFEIENIKKNVTNIEFEVFMMRNGCILSDANCNGIHTHKFGGICKTIRESEKVFWVKDNNDLEILKDIEYEYDNCLYRQACGLCAIYRMIKCGIVACKVVGRLDKHNKVLDDIKLVKKNIDIAIESSSEKEFFQKMVFPEGIELCKKGMSCYYPEIVNERVR